LPGLCQTFNLVLLSLFADGDHGSRIEADLTWGHHTHHTHVDVQPS